MTDSAAKPFGPMGYDPTVRKEIPIRKEQISQSELASLLEAATKGMKWFHTSFVWSDGSISTVEDLGLDQSEQESVADRIRRFHQLEELSGVTAFGAFHDDSSLWLILGNFKDAAPKIQTSAQAESSLAQERAYQLRTQVETFKGATRLPGKRRLNKLGVVFTAGVFLVLLTFSLFVRERGPLWLAVAPPILFAIAGFYLVGYVLFTKPKRPFVVTHPSQSSKIDGQRLAAWLQVGFTALSVALTVWMLYLIYRPPE